MNYKNHLYDKAFWILIWPPFRGCLIYSTTTLILLFILAIAGQPITSSFEVLYAEIPKIIKWSIFLTIVFNLGVLLITLRTTAKYLSEPPLEMNNLKTTLQEIRERNKKLERTPPEYIAPFILLAIVTFGLFNAYMLKGSWQNIFQSEIVFVLPFFVGLSAAYCFRILMLIGLLQVKYVIQLGHY